MPTFSWHMSDKCNRGENGLRNKGSVKTCCDFSRFYKTLHSCLPNRKQKKTRALYCDPTGLGKHPEPSPPCSEKAE